MRGWLALIFFSLCFQPLAFAQKLAPIDIVFDIDWTTFYSVEASQKDDKTLLVEGKLYRPTDHLGEVIQTLLQRHPEIRVSFFSGGERSRNETLLKQVFLPDGRSLKDIAYKILSKEHLTVLSQDETLHFSKRNKKVLDAHIPDWNPRRTILIDDQPEFARPPLKAVASLGLFNFLKGFDPALVEQKYFPPSEGEWHIERKKALLWLRMIEASLQEADRSGKDFSDVTETTWKNYRSRTCQQIFAF
ncbi:hypothetical protein [Bdellovibrio sp.]|uniref:hypothetical protein n=1 Tax=Bdellovibrio sp. TaxID=28201 RepID=UPI0039E63938